MRLFLRPRSIARQVSAVVLGDAIHFATGLVTSMILARVIPLEVMGTYRQIMYICPMAVALAEMGLSASIYRFWNALGETRRASYIKLVLLASVTLGALASLVLLLASPWLPHWYHNPDLKITLMVSAPYPLAMIPLMLLRPALISQGHALQATLLETGFALVGSLALVIPLWLGCALPTALGTWIGALLCCLPAVPLFFRRFLGQTGAWWPRSLLREVWDFIWPLQLARLPGFFIGYLDKIVMSLFLTAEGFAIYSLGAREIPFIGMLGISVASVLIPHLVEDAQQGRYDQICRRWRLACERTAMLTYLVGAFCFWHAAPVMQVLFSATYIGSSQPFRIFALLTFFRVIEYASLAKALGRTKLIMQAAFLSVGVLVALSIPLTWNLGIVGMPTALVLAALTATLFFLSRYRRLLNRPISAFYPWPRLLGLLALAFGCVTLSEVMLSPFFSLTLSRTTLSLAAALGVRFVVAGFIYSLLLWLFFFPKACSFASLEPSSPKGKNSGHNIT